MELDWSTFILELINFLVLIWILNRFLYQPVMNVIAQRKASIQQTLLEAEATRREAKASQEQYQNRLAEWQREREKARAQLREELGAERNRRLDDVRSEIEQERQKAAAVEAGRMKDFRREAEATAIAQSGSFASRLLTRLAGPELERRIVDIAMQDISRLSDRDMQVIRSTPSAPVLSVTVTSAYGLDTEQRAAIARACRTLAGREVSCEFGEDRNLVAGVRIGMGSWVLRANVQDELTFFSEVLGHA